MRYQIIHMWYVDRTATHKWYVNITGTHMWYVDRTTHVVCRQDRNTHVVCLQDRNTHIVCRQDRNTCGMQTGQGHSYNTWTKHKLAHVQTKCAHNYCKGTRQENTCSKQTQELTHTQITRVYSYCMKSRQEQEQKKRPKNSNTESHKTCTATSQSKVSHTFSWVTMQSSMKGSPKCSPCLQHTRPSDDWIKSSKP